MRKTHRYTGLQLWVEVAVWGAMLAAFAGLVLSATSCASVRRFAKSYEVAARSVLCASAEAQVRAAMPEGQRELTELTAEVARQACDAGIAALLRDPETGEFCVLMDPEDLDGTHYQIVCGFSTVEEAVASAYGEEALNNEAAE